MEFKNALSWSRKSFYFLSLCSHALKDISELCSVLTRCILVSVIKLGGVHSQYISQGVDHIKKPGQKPREWLVDDSSNVEVLGSSGTAVELVAHISRGTHVRCPSAGGNKSTAPLLLLFFNVRASHTAEMYQFRLDTLRNTVMSFAQSKSQWTINCENLG